jgi:single-strand DNA-binding protein
LPRAAATKTRAERIRTKPSGTTSSHGARRQAYVEGRIQSRTWEGRDGQKRTSVDIVADQVVLLGGRGDGGSGEGSSRSMSGSRSSGSAQPPDDFTQYGPAEITDDDIPF